MARTEKTKNQKKTGPDHVDPALRYVKDRVDASLKSVRPQVAEYWLNHAFIAGHQWHWWNHHRNVLEEMPRHEDRVQATVNRLWPDSRTVISKLHQRDLAFDVLPQAADDASLRGAALGEAVLEDIRIAHDWERIRVMNLWATWKGGTAAICVDWDPNAGSPITHVTAREDGGTGKPVFEGDTTETALSIAEFGVEPGAKDPVRARWWYKLQALPPEEVQATYDLDEKPPADALNGMSSFHKTLISDGLNQDGENADLTHVLTYYERPNSLCPKGRIVVIVGEDVLHDKPWPFPFTDRLNFAVTYETEVETRWTGDTVVSQARPIQVLYNAACSNIAEHMKEAGNARLAVPFSSIDLMDSMTDLPGEQIPYADGTTPPGWVAPPSMPNWWVEQPRQLKEEIDDLLGVHDVSRGRSPANIESGYGLSILSEQDNTPIGKMAKSMASAWSQVASMVLEIYGNQVKTTRRAVVSAPGQPTETADWTGEALMGQYRATIPLDAVLPRSRAAMLQIAKEMVQMQLITTVEEFSVLAELPGHKAMIERMKPDVAKARRENAMMAIGQVRIPATFDDHEQHLNEHNVFRKSERWDRLPEEVRELVNEHMQAHETLAAEAMGQARAQATVDPMTAAIPRADSRPVLPVEAMPPEAVDLKNVPGFVDEEMDGEIPSPEELAMMEDAEL